MFGLVRKLLAIAALVALLAACNPSGSGAAAQPAAQSVPPAGSSAQPAASGAPGY
jgi:hypothetical protein